jgi:chemotaxis protein MotA
MLVVVGAVVGGFTMAGGHVGSLIHPSEIVTIGGAAMGALIVGSSKKILADLVKAILATLKGSPFDRRMYEELFKCSYELMRKGRSDGLLSLESHLNDPHTSSIFEKYPRISHNHHVMDFLCGGLTPLVEGTTKPEQLADLMEIDLRTIHEEHHLTVVALTKTADALPGFGIVAAVLGIVITMGHIDGPAEEIGHKVGAALVGTFLGILLSYGFFAPLAAKIELMGHQESMFFRTACALITAFADGVPPKIALDQARRGVGAEFRPTRQQLEELFKEVESSR